MVPPARTTRLSPARGIPPGPVRPWAYIRRLYPFLSPDVPILQPRPIRPDDVLLFYFATVAVFLVLVHNEECLVNRLMRIQINLIRIIIHVLVRDLSGLYAYKSI